MVGPELRRTVAERPRDIALRVEKPVALYRGIEIEGEGGTLVVGYRCSARDETTEVTFRTEVNDALVASVTVDKSALLDLLDYLVPTRRVVAPRNPVPPSRPGDYRPGDNQRDYQRQGRFCRDCGRWITGAHACPGRSGPPRTVGPMKGEKKSNGL